MTPTPVELMLAKLPNAVATGSGWLARCPAHDDRRPSLSIGEGQDGRALVRCHAGCSVDAVCDALGLRPADLFPQSSSPTPTKPRQSQGNTEYCRQDSDKPATATCPTACDAVAELERRHGPKSAIWTYHDASGEPVGVVVRWDGPGGKEIRPVARRGDDWIVGGMPTPRPLYALPDLADAGRVFICEGEKAADAARSIGVTATTSAHGANSARGTDWSPLAGKQVVILPDADEPGRQYAEDVAAILAKLSPPAIVKIVELPGLPTGGDIVEWLDVLHGEAAEPDELRRELEALADAAPPIRGAVPSSGVEDRANSGNRGSDAINRPIIVNLADVQPRDVRWLWPGRVPLGKLTLIAGEPGLGKSFLTMDMAARVSTGNPWPDDAPGTNSNQPGSVVLLTAEDDVEDTIRPRLDAAGADVHYINQIQGIEYGADDNGPAKRRCFNLEHDLPSLEQALDRTPDCRLVIIDPVSAYLGSTDSHKNAEIRGLIAPLAELAARRGVAVVAVTHLNKATGGKAMHRAIGSIAFIAAARAGWLVVPDKENPKRRLLLPIKSNLAEDGGGLAFAIVDGALAWERDPVCLSADEALANDERKGEQFEREEVADWLEELLADGPVPKSEIDDAAKAHGITNATLRRAMKKLGIKPRKEGFQGGRWMWSLPGGRPWSRQVAEDAEDAQAPEVSTFDIFDGSEHLRGDELGRINSELAQAADDDAGVSDEDHETRS